MRADETGAGGNVSARIRQPVHGAGEPVCNYSGHDDGDKEAAGKEDVDQEGELEWGEVVQGFVLGSFNYGYATTQGVSWPAMHALIVQWIPPLERPRFIGIVYFVTAMSAWLTFMLCGFIISAWGWPAAFYVTGLLSIMWCFLWFTFMYNSPEEHPRISKAELEYIETAVQASGLSCSSAGQQKRVPWKQIFYSLPVWAIFLNGMGNSWGIGIYYSQLPTYMKNILGFSIKSNGMVSGLPFLTRYLGAITWSTLGDALTSRGYISVLTCRRVTSMIAMWGPAVMMVCLAYTGCQWQTVVIIMCAALFCNGAVSSSIIVNHTDIAPNFAGKLTTDLLVIIAPLMNMKNT
ncbi:putative inorganic phosphate cotransporter [Portunus trituberculatus]|uniref:Putative inorganic phosphate cotransporter n=1 Tax=Portunus trituberculatus TaxID=210409 RepID=A0A5B7GAS8_PORTR|nr:putative inorganic phosphate cotransporter [Portunus trituberculatus]